MRNSTKRTPALSATSISTRSPASKGCDGVRASVETGVSVSRGDSAISGEIISTAAQKNMLPVNITEGDQPKDSNEVALPEDMAKQLNVGIGDTVRLTSQYAVGTDGKAKADNVRVVGLTSDPNGAYSYYGGAIVRIATICLPQCRERTISTPPEQQRYTSTLPWMEIAYPQKPSTV